MSYHMLRWLTRSLHRKLTFVLVIATMVPVILLGMVSYHTASTITEEKAKLTGVNTLRQVNAIIETMVQDVENMSVFLIGQQEVQSYLTRERSGASEYLRMIGFLTNLAFSKPYISDIRIIPFNGNPELTNTTILQSTLFQQVHTEPEFWHKNTKWWSPPLTTATSSGIKQTVSLVRPIRDMNTFKTIGMLSIGIDTAVIAQRLRDAAVDGAVMLVQDAEGHTIAASSTSITPSFVKIVTDKTNNNQESERLNSVGEGEDNQVVIAAPVPLVPWEAYLAIPHHTFSAQNRYVLQLTAVAVILAVVIMACAVGYFVRRVTKPLIRLARHLPAVSLERAYRPLPVESEDEIGTLISSYNLLNENIGQLTEQVKRNEAAKIEADLQALQAQIQPHFLYNTLSSVQWMACMSSNDQIANMVGALGDFLRFSLNRGMQMCTVQQELEHIRNYLYIQSIRYPDRFTVETYFPDELMSNQMLKLLLQPLVENSIIHGLLKNKAVQPGLLTIEAETPEPGWIRLRVCDNGVGMTEMELHSLRERLTRYRFDDKAALCPTIGQEASACPAQMKPQGGYGLYNVQKRLLLHYGERAQLHVDSKLGEGTVITLYLLSNWTESQLNAS